jgi:hypothetical protein
LPAERLREVTAGDRAERVGADRDAGEVALIAAALARRKHLPDQGLRQRHQAAAAKALQHPRHRQPFDAARERAQKRADHEQRQRREHHAAAAKGVAQAAIDRGGDGVGDQVGHHDPRHPLDFAEARSDRRQRRRHDGLVGDRQKHRQHDRGKDGQKRHRWWLVVVDGAGRLGGGTIGFGIREFLVRRTGHAEGFL